MTTGKTVALIIQSFVGKVISLLFNMLSRFVIAFLPRSKRLLILWLQSPSAVILEPKNRKSLTASTFSSSTCHEVMGPDAVILVFRMLSFQPTFFTLLFQPHRDALCPSSLSVIRVVSPAHLRLLMFLPVILISTKDLFKKSGDSKGTFHARMGIIKDRNDTDIVAFLQFLDPLLCGPRGNPCPTSRPGWSPVKF